MQYILYPKIILEVSSVYIPKLYREEDREKILEFLRANNFPALVTYDGQLPIATHLPVEVREEETAH